MTSRDRLLAMVVPIIWGFNFVVIEWGMPGVPPLLFVAIRFVIVALPAVLFLVPKPDAPWWVIAAVGSLMSLGQFGFLYVSMHAGMPAGLASLVLQAQVVFTIVIAAGILRERPTVPQVVGVSIGAIGLIVVAGGRSGHIPLAALGLCLLAALCWASGNVVARAAKVPGGLSLTIWSATVVPIPLVLLSLVVDGPNAMADGLSSFGWQAALSTAYTAVLASFVGYGIWNTLLARYPSAVVVPWTMLVPPTGILTAWLCLGEVPNGPEVAGGVPLVFGVLIAQSVVSMPSRRRLGSDRAVNHS
ncbi:MAG: EamA family transporter [Nocardioides sp.]